MNEAYYRTTNYLLETIGGQHLHNKFSSELAGYLNFSIGSFGLLLELEHVLWGE